MLFENGATQIETDAVPVLTGAFAPDVAICGSFWKVIDDAILACPPKPLRDVAVDRCVEKLFETARRVRVSFLAHHVGHVYDLVTNGKTQFLRVDALLAAVARRVPGLVPGTDALSRDAGLTLANKDGWEDDQATFLHHLLMLPATAHHLYHAMALPKPDTPDHLARYRAEGVLHLSYASVERRDRVAFVTMSNTRFLNAEDDAALSDQETTIDVALLCPNTEICVLRGALIPDGKYQGQRIFGSGINLTRLYRGEIPYLWYVRRELGLVSKLYRGLARPDISPDERADGTREKLWVAQVDTFAIGGACQLLLVCDHIVAGRSAYMTLPARKEGIIPGLANMRLPRFVGTRHARAAIQSEVRFDCDSETGRLICDTVVADDQTDDATESILKAFLESGVTGAIANRRAIRLQDEPIERFLAYLAYYAQAQATCHFSPYLVRNLETFWQAKSRRV